MLATLHSECKKILHMGCAFSNFISVWLREIFKAIFLNSWAGDLLHFFNIKVIQCDLEKILQNVTNWIVKLLYPAMIYFQIMIKKTTTGFVCVLNASFVRFFVAQF